MSRTRLFCPTLAPGSLTLPPEEAHHAAGVLRCRMGDEVILFDGRGGEALAQIREISRRCVTVETGPVRRFTFDCDWRLTVAVVMGKAHRQSYLVEKCTELGAASIWPVRSERSVTRPGDSAAEKWSRRAIEAAKQSGRRWVPQVDPPHTLSEVLRRMGEFAAVAIADVQSQTRPFAELLKATARDASLLVLIGPEGGWSQAERAEAKETGAVAVSLAPTVLRTETAAVAACAAAALLSQPRTGGDRQPCA